jgi:hypothetical protein
MEQFTDISIYTGCFTSVGVECLAWKKIFSLYIRYLWIYIYIYNAISWPQYSNSHVIDSNGIKIDLFRTIQNWCSASRGRGGFVVFRYILLPSEFRIMESCLFAIGNPCPGQLKGNTGFWPEEVKFMSVEPSEQFLIIYLVSWIHFCIMLKVLFCMLHFFAILNWPIKMLKFI